MRKRICFGYRLPVSVYIIIPCTNCKLPTTTVRVGTFAIYLGRIRFCALILDFDGGNFELKIYEKFIKIRCYYLKTKNVFSNNAKKINFWQNIE